MQVTKQEVIIIALSFDEAEKVKDILDEVSDSSGNDKEKLADALGAAIGDEL